MKRGNVTNRLLDRYLGIPILRTTSLGGRPRSRPSKFNRVGVTASHAIGDTFLISAPLQDIERAFPEARIIYFAPKASIAAARLLPGVDELVEISITNPLQAVSAMRAAKLDVIFDFTQWQRITAFYTAYSGAKYRIGFRSESQHRHWHYDLVVEHSRHVHEIENFRSLIRTFGIEPRAEPELNLPDIGPPKFPGVSTMFVFHPWASGDLTSLREWPTQNWAELASRLADRRSLFLVTGTSSERQRCQQLCRTLTDRGVRAEPYIGRDGLGSIVVLLKAADLVVSVNTGIMHLAAILGTPTISLNGPTATHRWGPVGSRAVSVEPHGRPGGYLHFGFEFKGNPRDCMDRIRVQDVYQAACQLIPALSPEVSAAS